MTTRPRLQVNRDCLHPVVRDEHTLAHVQRQPDSQLPCSSSSCISFGLPNLLVDLASAAISMYTPHSESSNPLSLFIGCECVLLSMPECVSPKSTLVMDCDVDEIS